MQILRNNKQFDIISEADIINILPNAIYEISYGAFGRIFLQQVDDIKFPEKVYSNDKVFIEHILTAFEHHEGNLGCALVGGKGLGKSFTANMLAVKTGLPVIKITGEIKSENVFSLLNKIKQDFVLFIDEFEKIVPTRNNKDSEVSQDTFLSFLDNGTIRDNKMLFIITANEDRSISEYLKNRPSRLLYYKEYKTLPDEVIREIVKDLLHKDEFKEDLLQHLPYEDLNMDVLLHIIKEMNIHNKPYSEFKSFFNFKRKSYDKYSITAIKEDGNKEFINILDEEFNFKGDYIGRAGKSRSSVYFVEDTSFKDVLRDNSTFKAALEEGEEQTIITLYVEKIDNKINRNLVY